MKYANTYCSQCGKDLGPGDAGVSSCRDHGLMPPDLDSIDDGGPAFPLVKRAIGYHADIRMEAEGISVRDYFAAKAMHALITRLGGAPGIGNNHDGLLTEVAKEAYAMAAAMVEARKS